MDISGSGSGGGGGPPGKLSALVALARSFLRALRISEDFWTSQLIKLIRAISKRIMSCSIFQEVLDALYQ
jgi:hypothetical protein